MLQKTIVLTGGNSGLGLETAKLLAQDKSITLILGCRDQEKALKAVAELKKVTGNEKINTLKLDLSSFNSVKQFANQVINIAPNIDVLVCNAGVQITKGTETTTEGFEKTFGTNHLGHFLLTKFLMPFINKNTGKIVMVSSGTHFNPAIWQSSMFGIPPAEYLGWQELANPQNFKNFFGDKKGYARYATSKLCVLLFGYELNRKLKEKGSFITVNSFDPGLMPGTGLARQGSALQFWMWKNIMPVMQIFNGIYSVNTSAENFSKLIINSDFNNTTGKYFEGAKMKESSADSYNINFWKDLWTGSEKLTGETFEI